MATEVETKPAVISIDGGDALPATIAVIENDTVVPEAIDAVTEAVEEVSSDAVEIAQIEAEASVAIAETHAAVEIARIEASIDTSAELAELRERNSWLENQMMSMQEQIAARSIPQPSPETLEEVTTIIVPEEVTIDTSETPPETSSSTQTEAPSESAVESPVEEAAEVVAVVKRRLRLL